MKITVRKVLLLLFVIALSYGIYYGIQAGKIATAYVAKVTCSCTMVSERPLEDVVKTDVSKYSYIDVEVNEEEKSVTASALGLIKRKAIFRKGLGCTLVNGLTEEEIRKEANDKDILKASESSVKLWPTGDSLSVVKLPENIDSLKLIAAVNKAFNYPDQQEVIRSRAVVVVYKGKIIAEKYAPGISRNTPLLGWSMTKSVTNSLLGILVKDGKVKIMDKASLKEWQADERAEITIDQMMRMSSGLHFDEIYNVVSDATKMLFNSTSASRVAIAQPLAHRPDEVWSYSSGTTNILSKIIRDKVGGTNVDYFNFPRRVLFDRIGMNSMVMEPDPSGTFVGSSFSYATARDWARFGLLYLNDGVWEGERILPEGWVKYSSTPTPKAAQGQYGAHFWLNAGEDEEGTNRKWPSLPKDLYYASGFEGQSVVIIPSYEMVIVRLGNTQKRESWDVGVLIKDVLESVKKE
jgi:CubicO group peptidase (beta-lactamase class C family)